MHATPTDSIFKKLKFPDIAALIICTAVFIFWLNVLTAKFTYFGFNDWDLAFFTQAMHNLMSGEMHGSLFNVHFFSNHSNFFAYAILPFFSAAPHPLTLVIFKVFSFSVCVFYLYLIGKDILNAKWALALIGLYLIYPPNLFAIVYEFHFESFAAAFLAMSFYYFHKNRYLPFLITCVLLMSIKENMPLIVAGYGAYAIFTKQQNRIAWCVVPILLGGAYFYLTTSVLIPHFGQRTTYNYAHYYKELGSSPAGIALGMLKNPINTISIILRQDNLEYLFNLFKGLCFLPLLRPLALIIPGPIFLQHLMSNAPQMKTIYFHYAQTLAPFLFIALMFAFRQVRQLLPGKWPAMALALLFVLTGAQAYETKGALKHRLGYKKDYLLASRVDMVKAVDKNEGVIATFDYLAAFATRKDLYGFHKVYADEYQNRPYPFTVPPEVTTAVIDFHDRFLIQSFWHSPAKTAISIQQFFYDAHWEVADQSEFIIRLKRTENRARSNGFAGLVERLRAAPQDAEPVGQLDENLQLTGSILHTPVTHAGGKVKFSLLYSTHNTIHDLYSFDIRFINAAQKPLHRSKRHFVGYIIQPTVMWQKGEHYLERFTAVIPNLPEGKYRPVFTYYRHQPYITRNGHTIANPRYTRGEMVKEVIGPYITINSRQGEAI